MSARFQPVTLATIDGPRKVPVLYRVGAWAVHETLRSRGLFTVSHAPTGLSAKQYIGSLQAARKLAYRLHYAKGANWNFTDSARMSKRTAAVGKRLVAERC